tara:strand:- start:63 stop:599 length:537 start_codon:yes stop_codon:yes gene_type:complete
MSSYIYTVVPHPKSDEEYYYYDGLDYIKGILKSTQVQEGPQYSTTVNTINDIIVDTVYSRRYVLPQQNYGEKEKEKEKAAMMNMPPLPPDPHLARINRIAAYEKEKEEAAMMNMPPLPPNPPPLLPPNGGKRKSRHNRKINKTKKSYKKSTKSKKNKKSTRKRKTNKKRKSRRTYRRK